MYAIIQSGGRQLRVEPGSVVSIDHRSVLPGDSIVFDQILFLSADDGACISGSPLVPGTRVVGIVDGDSKRPKIRVFRRKRRKGMRRTTGHRTALTRVRITEIEAD